ncbi:MAG: methyltransferase domain-containing protein [Thermoleophilia bacterium]
MQPREYDIMYNLETTCWWHTGMMAIMEQILSPTFEPGAKLLDVGCGTGAKMQMLSRYSEGWDNISEQAYPIPRSQHACSAASRSSHWRVNHET